MKDFYSEIFGNKERILVLLAHPDDAEIIFGGTIARLIKDGKKVRTVIATNGNKGMHEGNYSNEEFRTVRLESQKKAGIKLGLKDDDIFNLDIPDGEFEASIENIEKIVFHLREFQPEIVVTHNPFEMVNDFSDEVSWINHRDHRKLAEAVFDATYPYCRDNGFFPDQIKKGLKPCYMSEFLMSDSYIHLVLKFQIFSKKRKML